MNKLQGRPFRGLFLVVLFVASVLPQVGGQMRRRHRSTHTPALVTSAAQHPKFHLDCTLPALTTEALAIDKVCANRGSSPAGSDSAKQNLIKNRFCLPDAPTTPVDIDFNILDQLQKAARDKGIPFGRKPVPGDPTKTMEDLPPDRSVVVDLITDTHGEHFGEGMLVRLEGFVFKAQHSNTFVFSGKGESVNCKAKTLKRNDIHIALSRTKAGAMDTSEASECETVTAEISPHHRSAIYNRFDSNPKDFLNGKKQKAGQDKLKGQPLPLKGARVRLTGQLFFDASHSAPCRNGQGAPPRLSIWEVHPVFAIEVFETTQSKFIPFEDWAQLHGN
ncbi:MAG: hypothetical protein ABJB61_01365 [bacterium]